MRLLVAGLALTLFAGCTTTSSRDNAVTDPRDAVAGALRALQRSLPGHYNNHHQARTEPVPALRLEVAAQSVPGRFLVSQEGQDDQGADRRFLWQLGVTEDGRLMLDFAPLIDGQPGTACRLELRPNDSTLVGATRADSCQVPNREGLALGLAKEIVIARDRLETGERLVDLDSGAPMGADSVLRFRRERRYEGWAGRLDDAGEWTLAQSIELHDQGGRATLVDSGGTPLGYEVELAEISYRSDARDVLRLAVIDGATGEQVGYAFAAPGSERIGLHLGWLQVGLSAVPAPPVEAPAAR
jgi:hypothetical protein